MIHPTAKVPENVYKKEHDFTTFNALHWPYPVKGSNTPPHPENLDILLFVHYCCCYCCYFTTFSLYF